MSVRWRRRFLNPAAHWRQESRPDVRRRRQFNCINCIDASLAAKLSCPNLPAPAPGTLPCGDVDQSTPRARKSCGCGGGSFNHILHLNKTGRLELAREGHSCGEPHAEPQSTIDREREWAYGALEEASAPSRGSWSYRDPFKATFDQKAWRTIDER